MLVTAEHCEEADVCPSKTDYKTVAGVQELLKDIYISQVTCREVTNGQLCPGTKKGKYENVKHRPGGEII